MSSIAIAVKLQPFVNERRDDSVGLKQLLNKQQYLFWINWTGLLVSQV